MSKDGADGSSGATGDSGKQPQDSRSDTPASPGPAPCGETLPEPNDLSLAGAPNKSHDSGDSDKQGNGKHPRSGSGSGADTQQDDAGAATDGAQIGTGMTPWSGVEVPSILLEDFRIPPFLLPIYQAAGTEYDVPWQVLAAINEIETDYGRNQNVSTAGAVGWMQFLPSTWRTYRVDANGDGVADPYNPVDAIFAAARYLNAAGAAQNLSRAIFAYNHADWYVKSVLLRAQLIGGLPGALVGSLTGLTEGRPPVRGKSSAQAADGTTPGAVIDARSADATVVAVQDARVVRIGESRALGRYVTLRDAYGNTYTYAHLGTVADGYLTPKPLSVSHARIERELRLPRSAPKPTAPATAGTQRKAAKRGAGTAAGSPTTVDPASGVQLSGTVTRSVPGAASTGGGDASTADGSASTPAGGETGASTGGASTPRGGSSTTTRTTHRASTPSTAHPSVGGAGAIHALDLLASKAGSLFGDADKPSSSTSARGSSHKRHTRPVSRTPLTASATRYERRLLRLPAKDLTEAPLERGATVPAGTILGSVSRGDDGGRVLFRIRPAGRNTPAVDPQPFLEQWRLAKAASVYPATPSVGQLLLMSKGELERRVLADRHIELYACGRRDVESGQIDRRVLATLEFLVASGLDPTVSSLECGHSIDTVSGNVSEHSIGDAVDIAAINGIPIAGHQGPGSITDITIRRLLTLQGTMEPHQIISLMSYPGAPNTLALPDHADHIHIGFAALYSTSDSHSTPRLGGRQWQRVTRRLSTLSNPRVARKPSPYAIHVNTLQGSDDAAGAPRTRPSAGAGTSNP